MHFIFIFSLLQYRCRASKHHHKREKIYSLKVKLSEGLLEVPVLHFDLKSLFAIAI